MEISEHLTSIVSSIFENEKSKLLCTGFKSNEKILDKNTKIVLKIIKQTVIQNNELVIDNDCIEKDIQVN